MSKVALEIELARPTVELPPPVLPTPARLVVRKPPGKKWTTEDLLVAALSIAGTTRYGNLGYFDSTSTSNGRRGTT